MIKTVAIKLLWALVAAVLVVSMGALALVWSQVATDVRKILEQFKDTNIELPIGDEHNGAVLFKCTTTAIPNHLSCDIRPMNFDSTEAPAEVTPTPKREGKISL
jgi:hypothetical protein